MEVRVYRHGKTGRWTRRIAVVGLLGAIRAHERGPGVRVPLQARPR